MALILLGKTVTELKVGKNSIFLNVKCYRTDVPRRIKQVMYFILEFIIFFNHVSGLMLVII